MNTQRLPMLFQRHYLEVFALVLLVAMVSGCANLSHGSTQSIQVVSDPPGAQVTADNDPVPYTTPATVVLKRGQDHVLVFRKEGFEDYSAELTRSMSGAVLGNLLLGGASGFMTDIGSGAAYDLGHANMVGNTLTIRLSAKTSTASTGPSSQPRVTAAVPESADKQGASSFTLAQPLPEADQTKPGSPQH